MHYAREKIPAQSAVFFAHRYITRPVEANGENHIALSTEEFMLRKSHGCFAMDWHSHQQHYGIGIEINQWLNKGIHVVINGSRQYLSQAAQRYPELTPVLIRVNRDQLKGRLLQRGRENTLQIEQRIQRNEQLPKIQHPRLITIDNSQPLAVAGDQLIHHLCP